MRHVNHVMHHLKAYVNMNLPKRSTCKSF